jgi:hypothetical protein
MPLSYVSEETGEAQGKGKREKGKEGEWCTARHSILTKGEGKKGRGAGSIDN